MTTLTNKRSAAPSFRDWDNPKRKSPYGWDMGHGSSRKRISFKTKADKGSYKRKFLTHWQNDRSNLLSYDADKYREFLRLEKELGDAGTLTQAVEFYLLHHQDRKIPLLSQMIERRMEDIKRQTLARDRHAKLYYGRFLKYAGDHPLTHYTKDTLQGYADKLIAEGKARATVVSTLRYIKTLFNVAVQDGVLLRSPAENIVLPSSRGEKRLSLIAPDKLEALLKHAWDVDQRMAGLLAIAFFTGLRMSMIAPPPRKRKAGEFLRLDMIDREAKVIHIPAGIMKTEAPLLIDQAPDCLWGWIKNMKSSDFGVAQNVFNDSKRLLCAHEDVKLEWTTNLARRSAASYLAAVFGRELASDIVGDTEEIFQKHYRVPALKAAGEKFFEIFNPN